MNHNELVAVGYKLNHGIFQIIGEYPNVEFVFEDGYSPSMEDITRALLLVKKEQALALVDEEYEAKRQAYLTAGATMSMVYQLKAQEAKQYKQDPGGHFLLLQASVDAGEAENIEAAADMILERENFLIVMAAQLEEERLKKKIAIKNAATIEELRG